VLAGILLQRKMALSKVRLQNEVESILGNTEKIKLYWMFWVVQGAKLFNKIFFLKSKIKYNDLSLPNHIQLMKE
jgi:hypothetical protein